jgi:hypothetical protein
MGTGVTSSPSLPDYIHFFEEIFIPSKLDNKKVFHFLKSVG